MDLIVRGFQMQRLIAIPATTLHISYVFDLQPVDGKKFVLPAFYNINSTYEQFAKYITWRNV